MSGRNYFRFSLRTIFIITTAFCLLFGYVGYEYSWIKQRQQYIHNAQLNDKPRRNSNNGYEFRIFTFHTYTEKYTGEPRLLWLFKGEKLDGLGIEIDEKDIMWPNEYQGIVKSSHPDIVRAKRLFPEATICPFRDKAGIADELVIEE